MSQPGTQVACAVTLTLLSLSACTRDFLPTSAVQETTSAAAISQVAPAPAPTPTIIPMPTPTPNPAAASCPTLLGIRVTVFASQPERNRVVLDATPLTEQCGSFPGRLTCPLGQAGSTERTVCEAARIGNEGPEWTIQPYGEASVDALPGTGYLAEVYGKGLVTACSRVQPDFCTDIDIR